MGLFDAPSRPSLRDQGDVYREKADRLAKETRQLFTAGRLTDAEERVRELINFQSKVVGERHPEYATGLCMLAEVLSAQDELSDAETLIQRALEIRKKALGDRHADYASGLDQMGRLMLRWEDFPGAEPLLVKALEIREATLGADHVEYAESLAALAEVLSRRDETAEAERLLRQALAVYQRAEGETHAEVAATSCRLSDVLQRQGQMDEAMTLLRQAIEVYRQTLGESHPEYMAAQSALASLLQQVGDLNAAEPIWRLLLDMNRQTIGAELPDRTHIQTQLGLLLQRRGDLKGAETLYRCAIESCKDVLGDRHPEYAASLSHLGLLLQRADDLPGAETLLRQALAVRKEVLGPRHPEYATSLVNLALLVQKRGDLTWARMLLKEAVEVRRAVFGEHHAEYAQGLSALADVHVQQGELAKAESLCRQALEIRRRALGEVHPVFAANLSSLAGILRRLGDLDGAEALLSQALEARKRSLGEEHPDYATNLVNLAWLFQRKGDRAGAEKLLTQALEVRRRRLGEEHPDYRQSLERLKSLRDTNAPQADLPSIPTPALEVSHLPEPVPDAPALNGDAPESEDFVGSHHDAGRQSAGPQHDFGDRLESEDPFDSPPERPALSSLNEFFTTCLANPDEAGENSLAESISPDESGFPGEADDACEPWEDVSEILDRPAAEALFDVEDATVCPFDDDGPEPSRPADIVDEDGAAKPTASDRPHSWIGVSLKVSGDWGAGFGVRESALAQDQPEDEEAQTVAPVSSHPEPNVMPTPVGVVPIIHGALSDTDIEPARSLFMSQKGSRSTSGVAFAEDAELARSPLMSQSSSSPLSQELAELSDRFSELGERLLTAARQLHAPGTPPPADLMESLGACRRDFESLRDRAGELAGSLALARPAAESLVNLQDLTGLLDQIAEAEIRQSKSEEQRRRSLSVLDRILALGHASNADFAPLRECQDKARELRYGIAEKNWMELPAEAERLAEGQHHFADLLSLIEDHDDLHDEHWATLHESVGQHFGKALAAAAARSKLVLPEQPAGTNGHH